jgi:hypothetical protein
MPRRWFPALAGLEPATRQYPLLLPAHLRALRSEILRIRRLCRLAAVVFHSFQRTCRKRRRSYLVHHGRPGLPDDDQTRIVHASCQRGLQARQRGKPAPQPATPSRLA